MSIWPCALPTPQMKLSAGITILHLLASAYLWAGGPEESPLREMIAEWRASLAVQNPQRLEDASARMHEWRAQEGEKELHNLTQQQADTFELLDFRVAEAWAAAGNYQKAAFWLKSEGVRSAAAPRGILDHTRNPDPFAGVVFALHAKIMAATGKFFEFPGAGYKVFQVSPVGNPPSYLFVYEPPYNEVSSVTIPLADEERIHIIQLASPGRYQMPGRSLLIGKRKGSSVTAKPSATGFSLVFRGITKVTELKGEFLVPHVLRSPRERIELKVIDGKIEQPLQALERMSREPSPTE